jgi:prefoldin subunit 5
MSDLRYRLHKMAVHQESVWGLTGVSDLLREADTYVGALESKVKGLEGSVALWNETGDAIMEVAVGRRAPLSDSEVTSVIEVLRTRVTELTDAIDVMRQNADSDRAYISSLEKDASNVLNRFLNQVKESQSEIERLKSDLKRCKESADEATRRW